MTKNISKILVMAFVVIGAGVFYKRKLHQSFSTFIYKQQVLSRIKQQGWQKTDTVLWKDKNGNLGFKVNYILADNDTVPRFITYFGSDETNQTLKEVIDLATFQKLNDTFYQDKQHVYQHYDMSDGGSFYIFDVTDKASFRVLNGCFAKDKAHIYHFRDHSTSIYDVASFQTCDTCWCLAKDKNGYYYYNEQINPNEFLQDNKLDKHTKNNIHILLSDADD